MPIITKNELGKIEINKEAVSVIAGLAAMESYGIVGMAAKSTTEGIFELLRLENFSKGIKVEDTPEGVNIELHVILQYGVRISTVAENIIENVKFNVEEFTDLKVADIDVFVEGIRTE